MSIAQLKIISDNAAPHDERAGVKLTTLGAALTEIEALRSELIAAKESRVCSCCRAIFDFKIPDERPDEGKYASRQFAKIAAVHADEARLAADGAGKTTAAGREG
jgi:hypothetical protein